MLNDTRGSHYRVVYVCVCARVRESGQWRVCDSVQKHRFIIDTNKLTFRSIGIFLTEDLHVDNF